MSGPGDHVSWCGRFLECGDLAPLSLLLGVGSDFDRACSAPAEIGALKKDCSSQCVTQLPRKGKRCRVTALHRRDSTRSRALTCASARKRPRWSERRSHVHQRYCRFSHQRCADRPDVSDVPAAPRCTGCRPHLAKSYRSRSKEKQFRSANLAIFVSVGATAKLSTSARPC